MYAYGLEAVEEVSSVACYQDGAEYDQDDRVAVLHHGHLDLDNGAEGGKSAVWVHRGVSWAQLAVDGWLRFCLIDID